MSFPADKTAIVVGADGFLGRHMVRILGTHGYEVHLVGKEAGDLSETGNADRAFARAPKVTRIFHLATRQRTGQIQYEIQGELLSVNARMHLLVLDAWRLHQPQAKLISTGSSCAYPELNRPIPETALQTGPMHPSVRGYGLAKHILAVGSETMSSQYGLMYLHCILATVYGPNDHKEPDRTHFMTGMIDRAVRERAEGAPRFTVWGRPDATRDLLYVDDQIEALLAADHAFSNTIINVSSNQPIQIADVAGEIVGALDWDVEVYYPPESFGGVSFKSIDAGRFLGKTKWKPRISLREGISRVLKIDYGFELTLPPMGPRS